MNGKSLQTEYRAKVTRRIALLLGILYLANPLYRPLQVVLHEAIAVFESPDSVIGSQAGKSGGSDTVDHHEHETLQLEYGHEIIDRIGLALNAPEDGRSSNESVPENAKVDKHLGTAKINLRPFKNVKKSQTHFFPIEKSKTGHPNMCKEPPRSS